MEKTKNKKDHVRNVVKNLVNVKTPKKVTQVRESQHLQATKKESQLETTQKSLLQKGKHLSTRHHQKMVHHLQMQRLHLPQTQWVDQ